MRLDTSFYQKDVLIVAPLLLGKKLIRNFHNKKSEYIITEVEAYKGIDDMASHARFGKTSRNAVMFEKGGYIYVYFIYGMYWMMNIVTGIEGEAQAVLIRSLRDISGPGKLCRELEIDKTFYGEDLGTSNRIWIEESNIVINNIIQKPRVGIKYASEPWRSIPWRYIMVP